MAIMRGKPLVAKLAAVAMYVVLPGAMLAAVVYSPPPYESSSKLITAVISYTVYWKICHLEHFREMLRNPLLNGSALFDIMGYVMITI
ncbi:hypothetical protein Pint_09186 [Pistacia integerrima]|uniref:Uncharacterized protein n=1 Tax=Pistacia integerrima TaxID=434235 RepID=A0ACC0XTZ7_9ROSI|nr:hypothetical protein Pint_09186 [Pistacia integerrima]